MSTTVPRVYLGGTRTGSIWREQFIKLLKINFDCPLVVDNTPEGIRQDELKRSKCDYWLYVLTPAMSAYDTITDVLSSSYTHPDRTVMVVLARDGDRIFDESQLKSLERVKTIVRNNGGQVFNTLSNAVEYLNTLSPYPDVTPKSYVPSLDIDKPNILIKNSQCRTNPVLLIGGAPSLNDRIMEISITNVPRFCINNSIKMVTTPDYWYATDIHVTSVFPNWIWKHSCKKYIPNPDGRIKQFMRDHQYRSIKKHIKNIVNYKMIELDYKYDKDTFWNNELCQVGYPYRMNKELLINGINQRTSTTSFLPAFKLAVDLNFDEIYLVGVDLTAPKSNFYAYDDRELTTMRHDKEVVRMEMLRHILTEQADKLEAMGVKVWNTNPNGGPTMFPYKPIPSWQQ